MDIDALLAPVAASSPCGEDLSFSPEFDQITELRREDDPTLDQGEWVTSLKAADWPGVVAACEGLLGQRTKDLRLAMWLTEALAMLEGFAGLDKGLLLCARLCEAHWAALHPRADDGDLEERAGNIRWLLQRVVNLAQTLPVTQGRHGGAFSLQDMAVARQRQLAQERQTDEAARQPADALTPEQFSRALKETPPPVLRATLAAARNCLAHLLVWQGIVDRHMGAEGPGFVQAKEALASTVHELERLGRECGALDEGGGLGATSGLQREAGAGSAGTPGIPEAADAGAAGSLPGGPPRSRAQALQQLREVAAFFRRTEPHSPVAYLAEKAVKWGDMPLHEWLRTVVKDQGAMAHLHELLGVEDSAGGDAAA